MCLLLTNIQIFVSNETVKFATCTPNAILTWRLNAKLAYLNFLCLVQDFESMRVHAELKIHVHIDQTILNKIF